MKSIWSDTAKIIHQELKLSDKTAEIVVIGAGMAGILIADKLQRAGHEVIILEAAEIAGGQTKNTTAKITSQHNLIYHKMITDLGEKKAKQYADANQLAIEEYARIINERNVNCDFERLPAYLYSCVEKDILQKEAEAVKQLGIDAMFTTDTTLPFSVSGAVKFNMQAQFHPLNFLNDISESLTIYENTKVISVEEDQVHTDKGIVTAKHIVFATHYPFMNIPGYYFMRMHQDRSYVIALENAAKLDGMYYGIDKENGFSFRNHKDLLLLGGGAHRTGENRTGGKYQMLKAQADNIWPDSRVTASWSAQDCITLDGIPYIGQYSSSKPNWYVATGFAKWGMTSSMVSAMIISDLIDGKENPNAEVFSPQRYKFTTSTENAIQQGFQAAKGIIKKAFKIPQTTIEELPVSHGGIVEYDDEKVGVYKNEDGESFIVTTTCPHMGCQLEWNPDELSWDCPCHGSRFDYNGHLIDNPAQESIVTEGDE